MLQVLTKKYIWALFIFATSLVVYLFTLCPTIYLEDSAEFVTVSATLGIAHPSGYPLYALLGKLFSFIPLGSLGFRINFMSAFFAALSCALTFLLIEKVINILFKNKPENSKLSFWFTRLIAASSSLILAFSFTFWSQAVVAEVYALNIFFVSLLILLLVDWQQKISSNKESKKVDKYLLLIIFLFALSATNHQLMFLLAPVFLIFVLLNKPKVLFNPKFLILALLVLILGLLPYLYLPLRSAQNPSFNWGKTHTVAGFKDHFLRTQYSDFNPSLAKSFFHEKIPLINSFFVELLTQFSALGLFLAVLGFIWMFLKDKKIWALIFGIFLFNGLFIIFLRNGVYSGLSDFVFRVYYLPVYLVTAVCLGVGLYLLYVLLLKFSRNFTLWMKKIVLSSFVLLVVLLPFSFALSNWQLNDRSDFWLAHDWARNALLSLEENAVVMVHNEQPALDTMLFSLFYLQATENLRPDVSLINLAGIKGIFYQIMGETLKDFNSWNPLFAKEKLATELWNYTKDQTDRPLYLLYPLGKLQDSQLVTRSNGYVYKLYENLEQAKQATIKHETFNNPRNLDYPPLINNLYYSDFVSDFYLAQASWYLENGYQTAFKQALGQAAKFDASQFSFNLFALEQHQEIWNSLDQTYGTQK